MKKPYFDLHIHPSFKPYLSHFEADKKKHLWTEFPNLIGIVESQGSLQQMKRGNVRIGVNPLYSLEKVFSTSFLTLYLAPKLTMLDEEMVNSAATHSYFDRLMDELAFLKKFADANTATGETFKILNNIDDLEEDKINIILAIEGGHGLEKTNCRLVESLRKLKEGPHRFLYMTLIHMIQFPLSVHAYGMKLMKKNDVLKPKGFGLSDLGKEVIDEAYRESDQAPRILIDIKHLSLLSRRQFYAYRREKGYDNIPILATHMGTTGISYTADNLKKYIVGQSAKSCRGYIQVEYESPAGIGCSSKRKKDHTYFNPWSINLYDEEIREIIDSGGLIGLNLDQRIQGADKVKGEYFSAQEFEALMENRISPREGEFDEEPPFPEEEELAERGLFDLNYRKHLRHLCNNLLNIVRNGGEKAWKQLCIGSDFDGLINPVNNCTDCTQYPKLEDDLVDMLGQMIEEAKTEDRDAEFFEDNLELHVRDIMYNNGLEFLKKHYR